ncbi:cell surface glycoprotein [Streptomyces sp. NPDC059631]|uniref:zinc finger domain-containing protein n=1 Tax=unclassified Streptomyces TaxID=2593676 RepID=UPI0036BFAC24
MTPREVAALLAYVVKLDPRLTLEDPGAAADRLAQWCDLLSDVPATAHGWDAARTARDHIARSPYRIQPSDISRPWHTHKADVMSRHVGTFEPTAHPHLDPDDEAGYRAALAADRHAVATGQRAPDTHRAITAGPAAQQVQRRLAALGTYMPRTVAQALAAHRPRRAEREQLAAAGLPDPLDVPCRYEHCRADRGAPCRDHRGNPRTKPHPTRIEDATTAHHAQEQPA